MAASVANIPIDSGITPQTLAFYNQLWSLWQNNKHVSAAWLSIGQTELAQAPQGQPEWNLPKLTTGQTPAMVCFNGGVVWAANGEAVNVFGAPSMTLANNWDGMLPLLQAVGSHGGAAQGMAALRSPMLYTAGSAYPGITTTVAAINALGYMPMNVTGPFSAGGGSGVIPCSDGLHPFTYTGLTTNTSLNGVVISSQPASNSNGNVTQSSAAAVTINAPVYPALLQTGNAGATVPAGYVNGTNCYVEAWPLHWSSSAYTTLAASQPTGGGIVGATAGGWADAQAANANGNLNAMLDGFAVLAAALSPYPLIMRPMPESNNGGSAAFWYDQGAMGWGPQLFRYIVGYLTGNGGFAGQPVTAVPVHNIIFATNSASPTGLEAVGTDFPTTATVGFTADLVGMDTYSGTWATTNPKSGFTTALGVTGYSNVPPILMEAYGNTPTHADPTTWGWDASTTGDLAGKTTLKTAATYSTSRQFAASGTIQIATTQGVQSVAYTSLSSTGTTPNKVVTFSGVTTTGVPTGSMLPSPVNVFNPFIYGVAVGTATVSPNTGCANFLTGIKDATATGCHFCINPLNYGATANNEFQSMLFQPGFKAIMQDPDTVNLPTPGNWSGFGWGAGQGTEWNWQSPLVGT